MSDFLSKRPGPLALSLLILVLFAIHGWLLGSAPQPRYWGDEPMYAQNAAQDVASGDTSLLPGALPFRTRPELGARVLAQFEPGPGLHRSASGLNLLLLSLTLVMIYKQARLLQLAPGFAVLAAGLLGCFPWFGFHVHSLWPEVLHAFLTAAALLSLLLAMERERLAYLIPCGVSLALALFTKGVLQPFVLLFAVILGVHFWRRGRKAGAASPIKRALLAPAILLASTLLTLAPQLMANQAAGHGLRLAANRWWNLELGLTANPRAGRSIGRLQREYFEAAAKDSEREELARERTLAYVRETGPWRVFTGQLTKFKRLLFQHESSLERSLSKMQRWGPEPPAVLPLLAGLGRGMWFALLSLGCLGMACLWRRNSGWFLVSSFSLGFLLAALLIPLKVRFLLPVFPFLALLTAGLLQELWARRPGQRQPS